MPERVDWEYMRTFALDLINFSSNIRDDNSITKQRIIILLLDQATELLMKSFLIRESKMGAKEEKRFHWCLKRISGLQEEDRSKIMHFHKLRNEIQHKALNLEDINKPQEIIKFYSSFERLCKAMFPEEVLPKFFT